MIFVILSNLVPYYTLFYVLRSTFYVAIYADLCTLYDCSSALYSNGAEVLRLKNVEQIDELALVI